MPRAGHCPRCDFPFDAVDHMPMVSVVCGHSLCHTCASATPSSTPHDAASISSDSTASDDISSPLRCPVCNAALAGFVKNFQLLAALPPAPDRSAPDLTSVVCPDLVVHAATIRFSRDPAAEVGRGASAVVYRGVYAGKPVAVKSIRTMSDSFTREDRLRRELRNASALKNPHIVEFRAAAWDHEAGPGSPRNILLVTELMAGGNLRESLNHLHNDTGLALDSFIQIGLQIARGIEYLHAEGLAHRDIKSANILLTERLAPSSNRFSKRVRAKIADFGLSKYIDKATGGGTVMQSIMEPGKLEATYAYLAPEAFGGDKTNAVRPSDSDEDDDGRYDEMAKKRDIYALGVLFWEMLTGEIPWSGVSLPDVYVRVCVRSDRPAPALDDTKVSKSIRRLVERCWSQNSHKRPSAKSIAAKLEKLAVRFGVADETSAAASVAVESVSVVSGQASNIPNGVATGNTMPDMHSEPLKEPSHTQDAADSLMAYQKMPSASTVYTGPNEGSKTHSTGFEVDARDLEDDGGGTFDDTVWVDDGDVNGKATTRAPHAATSALAANAGSTMALADAAENGPSSLNRRLLRPRHPATDAVEPSHNRSIHNTSANNQISGISAVTQSHQSPSPSPIPHGGKTTATAVAATAAAIAAAKDRERKQIVRGPAVRVARGANPQGGETSFQSLPNSGDGWQRNDTKIRADNKAVFYDNSDEEAQDFDPERAAAEEAYAQSNSKLASQSEPVRHLNLATRAAQAVRSTSVNRIHRPKSPAVRAPLTSGREKPFPPLGHHAKVPAESELPGRAAPSPGPKATDLTQVKKSVSGSRNRIGRTLSGSNGHTNRSATPVVKSPQPRAETPVIDPASRRAFIRRMRSNETARRLARSSSATGVENQRPRPPPKVTPSHASDTVASEDDEPDYGRAQLASAPKEDFQATVDALDKGGILRLLSQRMVPLRLAALANAALQSPKLRNEEEVLRNACAVLHRLTVPGNSSSQKNNVQEISPKEQLSIRKYLKSAQGVEALLQALHPPQARHPTTLSYGLLALGNVTAWDLEAHKHFRNAKGVLQITNVMKTHIKNSGVQEKGCYALACVGASYPAKSKTIFQESGALDVVIGALSGVQRENPNDAVTKQACAALGAMCSSSPPNALYSGRKDALSFLVDAFERFRRVSRVDGGKRSEMRLVCKAFIDLLCHDENRKLAGMKGGSSMIIRAMRIFRLDADFIEKGLTTLSEFCTYRSNGAQIVQANGIDDVVAAMERFRLSVPMQLEGARVLTLLMKATGDQARRRVVHAAGAEAIVFALERFGGIPENNIAVTIEACRALHMLFLMESTSEGEMLGRRMKKVKCDKAIKTALMSHRGNAAVQEKGREALKQLGSLKSGGGFFGWMRSGSRKS